MKETVPYDPTPGPPRLDPVANMRDVTEACIQHHGILAAVNDEIGNLNSQCSDLRTEMRRKDKRQSERADATDKRQEERADATDQSLARLRRLLLTMAGVQALVALCLTTGAVILMYAFLTRYPWKQPAMEVLQEITGEQQDGEDDGIRTRKSPE